jgi:tripartite-type tricarboxylate transporter receptor subunit TctC
MPFDESDFGKFPLIWARIWHRHPVEAALSSGGPGQVDLALPASKPVPFDGSKPEFSRLTDRLKVTVGKATAITALASVVIWATPTRAQNWPTRPVTMVVPFAAGGTTDVLGRIMGQSIGDLLRQLVVVENVAGAGGTTGSLRVARAKPDGSQFLLGGLGPQALSQTLYKKPSYNTERDFAAVTLLAEVPLVLIARKTLPVTNLPEFMAYAKSNQRNMTFASAGSGSAPHIGCVLLNMAMGTHIIDVPYRGSGPAMQDLIAGRVPSRFVLEFDMAQSPTT